MAAAHSLISTLTIVALLGFAGGLSAGPVQVAESERGEEAPVAPASAPHADPTPSPSALAAEIIKEAEAGAQASEQTRSTPRANVQAAIHPVPANPSARPQAAADVDPWGLREVGKAAAHWIKETVPWLRSDEDESSATKTGVPDAADWSASPLDGSAPGRGSRAGSTHLTGAVSTGPSDPTLTVGYTATEARTAPDPDQNIVRKAINAIREVLEHPMTWLVVSLFVIGAIAVKKMDRRPTK